MVSACILVQGAPEYYQVAAEAVKSLLELSDFEVVIGCDEPKHFPFRSHGRLSVNRLSRPTHTHRAQRFLKKFDLLRECLSWSSSPYILQLDADAMLVRRLSSADVENLLGHHDFAAVEQTTISGSSMSREDFLRHYRDYGLRFIDPHAKVPDLADFRFYNSGVVFGTRGAFERFVRWSLEKISESHTEHQVLEHMIADQDYFQCWANSIHPGSVRELPWCWNHCEHWDEGFPREGAAILHFSNFCNGPEAETAHRMKALRKAAFSRQNLPRKLLIRAGQLQRRFMLQCH